MTLSNVDDTAFNLLKCTRLELDYIYTCNECLNHPHRIAVSLPETDLPDANRNIVLEEIVLSNLRIPKSNTRGSFDEEELHAMESKAG